MNTDEHPLKIKKEDRPRIGAGRPKEWDKDKIEVALLEWVQDENNINLCGFSGKFLIDPDKVMQLADDCEKFRGTYNMVRGILGERRERLLLDGKLHQKAYDLNASTYDRYMRNEKRSEKLFDAEIQKDMLVFMQKLKEKEIETVSQEVKDQYESLMSQITAFQDKKKNAARYQKAQPKAK